MRFCKASRRNLHDLRWLRQALIGLQNVGGAATIRIELWGGLFYFHHSKEPEE